MKDMFSKKFLKSLIQEELAAQPTVPAVPAEIDDDAAAFNATLDGDTDPNDFGDREIRGAQDQVDTLQAQERQNHTGVISDWIAQLANFALFLNGTAEENQAAGVGPSIQSQLADAPCDSLLDAVSKSETKKITRIAQELSALREAMKGLAATNDDKSARV